jgi:beta-glucosidase
MRAGNCVSPEGHHCSATQGTPPGAITPSGKPPVTFPRKIEDTPAFGHYPEDNLHTEYAEGIYVGYRHYDRADIEPLFPFGHGLSYTKFDYSDLKVTPDKFGPGRRVQVSLTVRNSGTRAGAEVVQLYLHQAKSSADRPPQELKGFRRVMLNGGQLQTVTFTLDPRDVVLQRGEARLGRGAQRFRCAGRRVLARHPAEGEF